MSDERQESPDRCDDAELAREAARGSREALALLFRRHGDAVFSAARRVCGSREDAEDVLQDVFVGLPRALIRYEHRGRFDAWIRIVATRTALMRMRGRRQGKWEPLAPDLAAGSPSPDRTVDRLAADEVLAAMPDRLRAVFLLKEVDGYGHREIADLLGIGVSNTRVRLHRAWKFIEDHARGGRA